MAAGGHLRLAYNLEPSTLDPVRAVSGGDDGYLRPIYDYLLARTSNDEVDPGRSLAGSFSIEDETTIVLNLRQGVKFHDDADLTAVDVVWNHQYLTDPDVGSVSRQSYTVIQEIQTPDEFTAVLNLDRPNADLIVNLSGRGGQILSRQAKERLGDEFSTRPVGTGPFMLDEFVSGSHVRVKKNPNYWRKDASGNAIPYIDQLTMRVIPDGTTRLAAITTGDIELAYVDPKDVSQIEQNASLNLEVREGTTTSSCFVFNRDVAPADNVDLRRAMCWGVNPEAVNAAVYFGRYIIADAGVSPPATWAYQPVPGRPMYDPEKAKQFLANAGYPDGLDIQVITYSAPNIVQQTEVYQAQLREIGINWDVKVGDVGSATQEFFEGKQTPLYSTSWGAGNAPDGLFRGILGDGAFYNPSTQKHPVIQDLLDRAAQTYDQEERKQLYLQVNEVSLDEALWVPHLYGVAFAAISDKVQNLETLWYGLSSWKFDDIGMA